MWALWALWVLWASYGTDDGDGLGDALKFGGAAFYLAQFYAVAAQLHLIVNSAKELQLPLVVPAAQVASTVHADGLPIAVCRKEGTVTELLSRQFRLMPIACAHLHTGKAEFAFCTTG